MVVLGVGPNNTIWWHVMARTAGVMVHVLAFFTPCTDECTSTRELYSSPPEGFEDTLQWRVGDVRSMCALERYQLFQSLRCPCRIQCLRGRPVIPTLSLDLDLDLASSSKIC